MFSWFIVRMQVVGLLDCGSGVHDLALYFVDTFGLTVDGHAEKIS